MREQRDENFKTFPIKLPSWLHQGLKCAAMVSDLTLHDFIVRELESSAAMRKALEQFNRRDSEQTGGAAANEG